MKHIAVRIIIAVLTFAIGVCATVVWLVHREPVDVAAPAVEITHDINFADLVDDPERYVGRTVRFRGVMFESGLGLHRPDTVFASIGYDFDPNAGEAWEKVRSIFEDNTPYIPHRSGPCKRASVTVVGKIIQDENKTRLNWGFKYWVIIQELENVESCPRLWFHDA
jgi:hypothetical protein